MTKIKCKTTLLKQQYGGRGPKNKPKNKNKPWTGEFVSAVNEEWPLKTDKGMINWHLQNQKMNALKPLNKPKFRCSSFSISSRHPIKYYDQGLDWILWQSPRLNFNSTLKITCTTYPFTSKHTGFHPTTENEIFLFACSKACFWEILLRLTTG